MGAAQNKRTRKIDNREMERQGRGWMLGVWREKRAYRNRKLRNMSIVLFVTLGGNVTLDGGEAWGRREVDCEWEGERNVQLYRKNRATA